MQRLYWRGRKISLVQFRMYSKIIFVYRNHVYLYSKCVFWIQWNILRNLVFSKIKKKRNVIGICLYVTYLLWYRGCDNILQATKLTFAYQITAYAFFFATSFVNRVHTLKHRRGPNGQTSTQWTFNIPCIIIGYRFPYIYSDFSTISNLKYNAEIW